MPNTKKREAQKVIMPKKIKKVDPTEIIEQAMLLSEKDRGCSND